MPLLFVLFLCFVAELFGVAWFAGPGIPFVVIGYTAYLVQHDLVPAMHGVIWIMISMAMMVQGVSLAPTFLVMGTIVVGLMRYRQVLHESLFVYSGVTMALVAGVMLVMGGFEWTILNIFGTLVVVPILVKYGV